MPVLTSVPAPVPYWVQEAYFPSIANVDGNNLPINKDRWAYRPYLNAPPTAATPMLQAGPGASGGGAIAQHQLIMGVPFALRYRDSGDTWRLPFVPGCINPGATIGSLITREDWRVVWYRMPISDGAGGTGGGGSGHVWSWDIGGVVGVNWAQAGAAVQQYGIYGNSAGGIEYRSYSSAPALLETVALPGYTAGVWNTIDHVHISSAPGRTAQYNLYLNGVLVVARNFGTAVLPFVTAARLQMVTQSAAGIDLFYAYIWARGGRFGPDGREYLS